MAKSIQFFYFIFLFFCIKKNYLYFISSKLLILKPLDPLSYIQNSPQSLQIREEKQKDSKNEREKEKQTKKLRE